MKKPEIKFFGLVRDKDGNPKIDGDPNKLPAQIKEMLTNEEKIKLRIK